jgi:hypothetical protein
VKVLDLIRTENVICNKIITAFAALCCECKFLVHECERKYLPAILFFGEGGQRVDVNGRSSHCLLTRLELDSKEQQQTYMAQFVSLLQVNVDDLQHDVRSMWTCLVRLQDLSCYVNRCNEVVMNTVQQLSALYTPVGMQNGRYELESYHWSYTRVIHRPRSVRLMDVSDLHLPVLYRFAHDKIDRTCKQTIFRLSTIISAIYFVVW